LEKVKRKELVRSSVGTTGLAGLPALLASAALFVGNNSGPQHIAAGLGVPTVGVHSGVVDAREWGRSAPMPWPCSGACAAARVISLLQSNARGRSHV
jgi:ADP-heptose:LPS heptosyltransferase